MAKCEGTKCSYYDCNTYVEVLTGNRVPHCNWAQEQLKVDEYKGIVYICDGCKFAKKLNALEKNKERGIIRKYPVYIGDDCYTAFLTRENCDRYEVRLCKGEIFAPEDESDEWSILYLDATEFDYDLVKMIQKTVLWCKNTLPSARLKALEEWDGH